MFLSLSIISALLLKAAIAMKAALIGHAVAHGVAATTAATTAAAHGVATTAAAHGTPALIAVAQNGGLPMPGLGYV